MRYGHAVEKLRILAAECESVKNWPPGNPFLRAAYVFGDVLEGADPLEFVEVALALNLPPEQVPWESSPRGTALLADRLRLDRGGFAYWWRSHLCPVTNHYIRGPVRFWSLQGPDEAVLQMLAQRRFGELPRMLPPSPQAWQAQLAHELATALDRLRTVHASYWDPDWRREHRGSGRSAEQDLWEAVDGYLDLRDAAGPANRTAGTRLRPNPTSRVSLADAGHSAGIRQGL